MRLECPNRLGEVHRHDLIPKKEEALQPRGRTRISREVPCKPKLRQPATGFSLYASLPLLGLAFMRVSRGFVNVTLPPEQINPCKSMICKGFFFSWFDHLPHVLTTRCSDELVSHQWEIKDQQHLRPYSGFSSSISEKIQAFSSWTPTP